MTAPAPNKEMMLRALELLYAAGDIVELRIIRNGRKQTDAGYFDSFCFGSLAAIAAANNKNGNVYIQLNPIDPQLHGRYHNRLQEYADSTATDANVLSRRWFLIDCDPIRPKGTSSTDAQLQAAMELADKIRIALSAIGFPEPVVCMSGNGAHLLYKVDLPNTDEIRDMIKNFLIYLAKKYDNKVVSIDKSVFNAGRVTKLYGTVAMKGDHTTAAPHRTSYIVSVPDTISIVDQSHIAGCIPVTEPQPPPRGKQEYSNTRTSGSTFDLIDFLSRLAIPYTQDTHSGTDRFKLDYCPFNSEHGKGESAIFQSADGKLGFKCQHDTCSGYHWKDVRALVDGERKPYNSMPFPPTGGALSCDTPDILTDQRIKYYFANSYASLVQYVPGIGWHYWDGRRWCTNMAGGLHVLIDKMQRYLMNEALSIQDEEERMKRRKTLLGLEMHSRQLSVIQACQTVPALITESPALDKDMMLFNTLTGTLDLRTGNMRHHDPADMITRISTIEYDASAVCPTFMKFITWAMCDDADTVAYLQRFIGYCLSGKTTEQKLVFMYGLGKNGKTTLINVIQELLGDYSSNADTTLIMKSNNSSDGNRLSMLAGIRGARAVTLSEVNDGQQLDAAAIKSFTGGDSITCRHLYEGFFSYTPQAKLIGFGNYKPHVRDTDHGIWRRIDLVPFKATCAEEDTDGDLPNKLRAELPGILAWAVRGCLDWQRMGLAAPESIRTATREYRQTEDIFASWLGECCGVSPHRTAVSTPLLESFKEFSGWRSTSHKKFGNMLSGHGFKSRKSNGKVYWDGLDLQISDDSDFRPPFSEKSHKKEDLKSFPEYPPKGHYGHCSEFFDGREFHVDEGDFL